MLLKLKIWLRRRHLMRICKKMRKDMYTKTMLNSLYGMNVTKEEQNYVDTDTVTLNKIYSDFDKKREV